MRYLIPHPALPPILFPQACTVHVFFCDSDNSDPSMEAHRNPLGDEESRRMRKPLLHDGPIVNVTTLAESRYNDSFPRTGSPLDRFLVL